MTLRMSVAVKRAPRGAIRKEQPRGKGNMKSKKYRQKADLQSALNRHFFRRNDDAEKREEMQKKNEGP